MGAPHTAPTLMFADYTASALVVEAVEAMAEESAAHGTPLEEVIDSASNYVRRIAPTELVEGSHEWQRQWRAYFALHDTVVTRAIRSYVLMRAHDTIPQPTEEQVDT